MPTLNIKTTTQDNELYHHYHNQSGRQPVALCLELDTGNLSADWDASIGRCTSHRAFHGIDLEWSIPPLRVRALRQLQESLAERCQQILDDSTVEWDGSNHVGRLGANAEAISEAIEQELESTTWEESDTWEPWAAGDYYAPVTGDLLAEVGLSTASTRDQVRAAAEREVADAPVALDVDDVESYLTEALEEAQ